MVYVYATWTEASTGVRHAVLRGTQATACRLDLTRPVVLVPHPEETSWDGATPPADVCGSCAAGLQ